MEKTTKTPTLNLAELKQYHLEIYRRLFSESGEDYFSIIWRNHLQHELVVELIRRESEYFAK
jgi:hypothetical protein